MQSKGLNWTVQTALDLAHCARQKCCQKCSYPSKPEGRCTGMATCMHCKPNQSLAMRSGLIKRCVPGVHRTLWAWTCGCWTLCSPR